MEQKVKSRAVCLAALLLLALLTLFGAAKAYRTADDPRQAITEGVLLELNSGWQRETECRAEYALPDSLGEGLMLSVRAVKSDFTLALRDADGQETAFYHYFTGSGPAEMRVFVALPDNAAGKTLVLEADTPAALAYMLRCEVVLGTQGRVMFRYFWHNLYALLFFLLCVVCAAGLCVLLAAMRKILRPGFRHQAGILVALILDAGIWVLTDSEAIGLATDRASLIAFLSLVSFGLLAPLTLEFVSGSLRKECRPLRILQAVMLALLAVDILGWLLAQKPMFWLLVGLHLCILASIGTALYALFESYSKKQSEEVRDILLGFAVLAVCVVAALVLFYGNHMGRLYALIYCAGLLGFLLLLGHTVSHRMKQAVTEQMQLENYKKLAYVDSLTGLSNYTAFQYVKARWPERTDWVYVVMDVNWLKQTNDQHGHQAGDELLRCAARCIREAFYQAESCCRIGGDEFAAVGTDVEEADVQAMTANLEKLCTEWSGRLGYPVSIAVGYAMQAGRTMKADELFAEADAAMYQNKAAIKKACGGTVR